MAGRNFHMISVTVLWPPNIRPRKPAPSAKRLTLQNLTFQVSILRGRYSVVGRSGYGLSASPSASNQRDSAIFRCTQFQGSIGAMCWGCGEADLPRSVPLRLEIFHEPRRTWRPRAGSLSAYAYISISNSSVHVADSSAKNKGGVRAELRETHGSVPIIAYPKV